MVTKVIAIKVSEIVTRGDNIVFPFTLTKAGATYPISGFTITGSIRVAGQTTPVIADHAVVIVSGAAGTVTLTLTKAESLLLEDPKSGDPFSTIEHVGDILVVEDASTDVHCGPFSFPVRRPITGAT